MSAHLNETPDQLMRRKQASEQILNKMKATNSIPGMVFDEEQRFEQLKEVFIAEKEKLKEIFGQNAQEIHQVGSTAIKGMPGTRIIDIGLFLQSWPPTDEESAKMNEIGYKDFGQSPHFEDDIWFLKLTGNNDYGDSTVHVAKMGNIGMQNMVAFVEYCNAVPEAAEKYKQMKLEAARQFDADLMKYKHAKGAKLQPLIQEAWEWKQKQEHA